MGNFMKLIKEIALWILFLVLYVGFFFGVCYLLDLQFTAAAEVQNGS